MGINYTGVRNRADRMIQRYGQKALLRRGTTDRDCIAVEASFTPSEKRRLQNLTDRKMLISAKGLDIPPDNELDKLVMLNQTTLAEIETLKINAPPGRLSPGGLVIYWELQVRG